MSEPGVPSAAAAEPLLSAMADCGVRRLMLLGSNGEGPLIPYDVTGAYVGGVVERWRALVPDGVIMVNVTAAGTQEAGRRAADAAAAGADALVSSPPTFFRHRDDEVVAHFAALGVHGLPVVAYNTPRSTPLNRSIVEGLLELPHLIGVKDSSGDPATLALLISAARPGFQVSQGDEHHLTDALRAGAHGITPGIANLAPRLALDLFTTRDDQAQQAVNALTAIHQIRPGIPAVKAILHTRGLCPPHASPPLAPCTPTELRNLLETVAPAEHYLIPPAKARPRS
jgi:4-hydroxy-tetrahydrodipicolinate synthase